MDARTAMIDAAEVLFAERGVGAVSLREVGAAAGQRNNSAAQYHFGTREGLVTAVFERRMIPLNEDRQARLDRLGRPGADDDIRALVDVVVSPLAAAIVDQPSSHYARFFAQILASDLVAGADDHEAPFTSAYRAARRRIDARLANQPAAVRRLRTTNAVLLLVNSLAAWELARERGRPHASPELLRIDLIDSIVGLHLAPTTVAAASDAAEPSDPRPLELTC